jgi:hypothetical protein
MKSLFFLRHKLFSLNSSYYSSSIALGLVRNAGIDIRKNTLLPDSRYSFGFGAPSDLALPIVASYRVFLDENYNWVIPFDEFAQEFLEYSWVHYRKYLISEKTLGNTVGTKICRSQEIWECMYILAQSYLNKYLTNKLNPTSSERPKLMLTAS